MTLRFAFDLRPPVVSVEPFDLPYDALQKHANPELATGMEVC